MAGIISALGGFFGSASGKIFSVAFLLLLGLLAWEKRTNADLHEQLGSLSIVSAGQVRAISELKADNAIKDKLLRQREAERAQIRDQLEKARLDLERFGRDDPDFAAWRAAGLPAAARRLLENDYPDRSHPPYPAGDPPGSDPGTGLARRN